MSTYSSNLNSGALENNSKKPSSHSSFFTRSSRIFQNHPRWKTGAVALVVAIVIIVILVVIVPRKHTSSKDNTSKTETLRNSNSEKEPNEAKHEPGTTHEERQEESSFEKTGTQGVSATSEQAQAKRNRPQYEPQDVTPPVPGDPPTGSPEDDSQSEEGGIDSPFHNISASFLYHRIVSPRQITHPFILFLWRPGCPGCEYWKPIIPQKASDFLQKNPSTQMRFYALKVDDMEGDQLPNGMDGEMLAKHLADLTYQRTDFVPCLLGFGSTGTTEKGEGEEVALAHAPQQHFDTLVNEEDDFYPFLEIVQEMNGIA
jgi:hypothetical protein